MNSVLNKIKSSYNLKELFTFVDEKIELELFKYNKYLQNKAGLTLENYKSFKNIIIHLEFDEEFVNSLRNEFMEIKNKIDNKNYENEEDKKKLIEDLDNKSKELKRSRFMGLPFFNQYKEFIKIFYDDKQGETTAFYNFLDNKTIPKIKILIDKNANINDCFSMFANCMTLKEIKFIKFNTKDITSMRHMFYLCSHLRNLDLSKFDTSNVTTMFGMFKKCYLLESLKISESFVTSKVEDMQYLFEDCNNITTLDLHYLDTSNIDNLSYMFKQCKKLQKVDISKFNTEKVFELHAMFEGCESLTNVNLSSFKTNNLKSITNMFSDCKNLYDIDLSNFNFEKLEEVENSFTNCPAKIKLRKNSKLANFIPAEKIIYVD